MSTRNPLSYSNQFERGHSFNWAGQWTVGKYYMNDEYVTDFIVYKNAILVCRKTHKATAELEPQLVMSGGKSADVNSPYWEFIVSFLDSNPAGIQNVEYSESSGKITISYSDGRYDEFDLNIKISDNSIHVGNTPPDNEDKLWLDMSNSSYPYNNKLLTSIQEAVAVLQQKVNLLMNIREYGAVAGSLNDSTRQEMMAAAEAVMPSVLEGNYEDAFDTTTTEIKPDYKENVGPTVNSVSIKIGSWEQLVAYMRDFVQGELMWCTDRKKLYIYMDGKLLPASSSGGSSDDTDDMDNATVNLLIDEKLESVSSIGFVPIGSEEPKYTVKVDEYGNLICYDSSKDERVEEPAGTYMHADLVAKSGLLVNSFYLGGEGDEHSYQPCSHNFVELSNVAKEKDGTPRDINLNGLYLYYRGTNTVWQRLPLWGTVKSNGTFLIRGKQCSVMDVNTTVIKVKTFDQEWYVDDGKGGQELISFDQVKGGENSGVVFYIAWGEDNGDTVNIYNLDGGKGDTPTNLIDVDNGKCAKGYVDLASVQVSDDGLCEKKPYQLPNGVSAKDVLFRRWYIMDPVTQSNPSDGISKHNNTKYLTCTFLNGANFDNLMSIEELTPKASFEGKTMAASRTLFAEDKPSTLTCTFGIQATYNVKLNKRATRCFCWNSVGYYDEGIKYRRKDSTDEWRKIESFKTEVETALKYQTYYNRIRWESSYGQAMTTHKVIIRNLVAGTYEYQVYREGDDTYTSDLREFTVRTDNEVNAGFTFAQTTDQQGANWEEYELWNLSAKKMVAEAQKDPSDEEWNHGDFDFIINTGDICYNGSRSNEWIDYFNGYKPLRNKEEMLTIGNNDLAPISMRDIGTGKESPWKINVNVVDYFYCFEIDEDNPCVFSGKSAKDENATVQYRIPSLYSFNYGDYHFVSLLSEIRTRSNKEEETSEGSNNYTSKEMSQSTVNTIFGVEDVLRGDGTNKHASAIYDVEERWLIKDLLKWKGITNVDTENTDLVTLRCNENLKNACGKCIIFIHEMPFNIVSGAAYYRYEHNSNAPRETSKAYLNRYHDYEYQRAFKIWGIRMVMGGHKHTAAMTQPVYDAPLAWDPCTSTDEALFAFGENETSFNDIASFQPIVQVLKSAWDKGARSSSNQRGYNTNLIPGSNVATIFNHTNDTITVNGNEIQSGKSYTYTNVTHPRARIEVVDSITAPSYIMCQATGFKNESNSDLACPSSDQNLEKNETFGRIPWEDFYVAKDNVIDQCYPFYTIYNVSGDGDIEVKMYKIQGFYTASDEAGYWDIARIYDPNKTLDDNRAKLLADSKLLQFNTTPTIINTN